MAIEASKWRSKGGQHRRGFINVKSGIHLSDIFTDTESMECFYKLLSSNKNQLIENGIEVNGRRRYADNTKVRTYYYYYYSTT